MCLKLSNLTQLLQSDPSVDESESSVTKLNPSLSHEHNMLVSHSRPLLIFFPNSSHAKCHFLKSLTSLCHTTLILQFYPDHISFLSYWTPVCLTFFPVILHLKNNIQHKIRSLKMACLFTDISKLNYAVISIQ